MKGKSKIQLVLWALLFVVTMSFSAYGADGQIKIGQTASTTFTFPIVIDQPGSYVLTSIIIVSTPDVNGVEINTDNVTLDLNGHAVIGLGDGSGNGIYVDAKHNISVVNGTVRDFGRGIKVVGIPNLTANFRVRDINAFNNGTGIEIDNGILTNCLVKGNSLGIFAQFSIIDTCQIIDNVSTGITARIGTITNSYVAFNGGAGTAIPDTRHS